MAKRKSTPEEQLLDLIEKDEESDSVKSRQGRRSSFFSIFNFKRSWLLLKKHVNNKLGRLKKTIKEPDLKVLNKVLLVVSICLFCYLIVDFVFNRPTVKKIQKKVSRPKQQIVPEQGKKDFKAFVHYLERIQGRNIFNPITLEKEKEETKVRQEELSDKLKNLELVGMSLGENPEVMIENKRTEKTYFLKEGDTVNQLKIKSISKNGVVLSYKGEEMNLK